MVIVMYDDLGDRMKSYENIETSKILNKSLPIYIRIDGRCFSNFTSIFNKPFDENLSWIMTETTQDLVKHTNARIGYTQSDEISLVLYNDNPLHEPFFAAKTHKLNSVLASLATSYFISNIYNAYKNNEISSSMFEKCLQYNPSFDCRSLNLPDLSEAANMFVWRSNDCIKNSISSAARSMFSHNELQNKNSQEMIRMMKSNGVDFYNHYPIAFTYGSWIQIKKIIYNDYTRSEIHFPFITNFAKCSNKIGVVFNNEMPVYGVKF